MSADQPKPRFEPPPWEQDAFEHFRKAQNEELAREELEAALRDVRATEPVPATDEATPVVGQTEATTKAVSEAEKPAALPEARINAMLIELRIEEPPAPPPNKRLVWGTMAFMVAFGAYIIIQSALLFRDVRTDAGAGTLLAGLLSFMVLLIGLGFLGGAFLLFRKYREHL